MGKTLESKPLQVDQKFTSSPDSFPFYFFCLPNKLHKVLSFHFVFIYFTHLTFDLYFIVSSSADLAANINLSVLVLMLLCNPNVTGATLSSTLINPRPPLSLSVGSYSLHYSLDRGHYA